MIKGVWRHWRYGDISCFTTDNVTHWFGSFMDLSRPLVDAGQLGRETASGSGSEVRHTSRTLSPGGKNDSACSEIAGDGLWQDGPMEVTTLAARPDLLPQIHALAEVWPEFMRQDGTGELYYPALPSWSEFVLAAIHDGRVIARAVSLPFAFGSEHGRSELPDDGWDAVIRWGHLDRIDERQTNCVAALEIAIDHDHRGKGLSARMVSALRDNSRRLGYRELVAPVRPSEKHLEPETPMSEYAGRTRDDGLPHDRWLRVHVRAGAEIVKVCPTSMTIVGTPAEWSRWTGLSFATTGPQVVPFALVPAHVDVEHDYVVYVEPNVWVRHDCR